VPPTADLERILRGASLRVTRPRVAVLAVVYERPHADTSTILAGVRQAFGEVSQQAVYDRGRRASDRSARVRGAV
jgi:Fe2+ or Zn2+ uptake regulation protein